MGETINHAKEDLKSLLRDYGLVIAVAIAIALTIRVYIFEAYRIPSLAMRPTLEAGDTIFVSKWPYTAYLDRSPPAYGDVIVFSFPDDPKRDYIKRIVALPSDKVQIQSGKVLINGKQLGGSSFSGSTGTCGLETSPNTYKYTVCIEPPILPDMAELVVGPKQVFVVGDGRTETKMSEARGLKSWGLVPYSSIKGKALWIWLSIEPSLSASSSSSSIGNGWFSRIRFERMFRKIE